MSDPIDPRHPAPVRRPAAAGLRPAGLQGGRDTRQPPQPARALPPRAPRCPGTAGARAGWAACTVFLLVSLPATWFCSGERSAWVLINFPGDRLSRGPVLGPPNCLLGPEPVMWENLPFFDHAAFFSGVQGLEESLSGDAYVCRPYYGFLAALLAPARGITGAMHAVNWLAWALCAWVSWRLARELFRDDLAGLLAVVFTAGGMGMIYHIADCSAHLLSFAAYYLGVYLIYTSGVLFKTRPLRTHLQLGAYLAVASLAYPGSIMLIPVYALAACRRNPVWCLAAGVGLALTARPLWKLTLHGLGVTVADQETQVLVEVFGLWGELFRQHVSEVARGLGTWLTQPGVPESLPVLILGLAACVLLPRRPETRWFGVAVLAFPLFLSLVTTYTHVMSAYQYYGISVWLYCWLGRLLAKGLRGPRGWRLAAAAGLGLAVGGQVAWSTAYLWDWLGPLKTYIGGWPCGRPHLAHPHAEVLSLTGAERTPRLFGGDGRLPEAGVCVGEPTSPVAPAALSFRAAFLRRLLPGAYLALWAAFAGARSWRGYLTAGGVLLAAALGTAGLSRMTLAAVPSAQPLGTVILPAGGKLVFRVTLGPAFRERLGAATTPGDRLCWYIPEDDWQSEESDAGLQVALFAGSTPLPVNDVLDVWAVQPLFHIRELKRRLQGADDTPAAVRALLQAGELTVELVNGTGQPVTLLGWQRRAQPGRRCDITSAGQPLDPSELGDYLPAIEIRLMRPDGSLKVIGF